MDTLDILTQFNNDLKLTKKPIEYFNEMMSHFKVIFNTQNEGCLEIKTVRDMEYNIHHVYNEYLICRIVNNKYQLNSLLDNYNSNFTHLTNDQKERVALKKIVGKIIMKFRRYIESRNLDCNESFIEESAYNYPLLMRLFR